MSTAAEFAPWAKTVVVLTSSRILDYLIDDQRVVLIDQGKTEHVSPERDNVRGPISTSKSDAFFFREVLEVLELLHSDSPLPGKAFGKDGLRAVFPVRDDAALGIDPKMLPIRMGNEHRLSWSMRFTPVADVGPRVLLPHARPIEPWAGCADQAKEARIDYRDSPIAAQRPPVCAGAEDY
jgi:hypothetical protein